MNFAILASANSVEPGKRVEQPVAELVEVALVAQPVEEVATPLVAQALRRVQPTESPWQLVLEAASQWDSMLVAELAVEKVPELQLAVAEAEPVERMAHLSTSRFADSLELSLFPSLRLELRSNRFHSRNLKVEPSSQHLRQALRSTNQLLVH